MNYDLENVKKVNDWFMNVPMFWFGGEVQKIIGNIIEPYLCYSTKICGYDKREKLCCTTLK